MKLGQRYNWISKTGKEWDSMWIGSILDVERYLNDNVYCPVSGFNLVKEKEKKKYYDELNERARRIIKTAQYVRASELCKVDPAFVEYIVPLEYTGDYETYTEEDEDNSYDLLPLMDDLDKELYHLNPTVRALSAFSQHLDENLPDSVLSQELDMTIGFDY